MVSRQHLMTCHSQVAQVLSCLIIACMLWKTKMVLLRTYGLLYDACILPGDAEGKHELTEMLTKLSSASEALKHLEQQSNKTSIMMCGGTAPCSWLLHSTADAVTPSPCPAEGHAMCCRAEKQAEVREASHRIRCLTQQHLDEIGSSAPHVGGVDVRVVRALLWPPPSP